MQTKLTLRLDKRLVRRAKEYARRNGTSVSQVVANFFGRLGAAESQPLAKLSPEVQSLIGAIRPEGGPEADYRRYLERKHGGG